MKDFSLINVVLIDDERPALRELEYLLKDIDAINILGMYTNPLEAIQEIDKLNPQVVFLDINMPQLKGIDAASRILDKCPLTDIVFVTAYNQYAIEAFEIHALDYILKPVSKERFDKTLQRIINKANSSTQQKVEKKFKLQAFGRFQAGWEGQEPIKWRSEKTKELFAFLLYNAGREVSKDEILEAVYSDTDIEKAIHQLHNGIYYIKKTLQEYGVDKNKISIEGNYILRLGEVDVDSLMFKKNVQNNTINLENLELVENTLALYTADYFEGMDWAWAEAEREKLLKDYIYAAIGLAELYIQNNELNSAEELLLKAYKKSPYLEDVTKFLLMVYKLTNRKSAATKHFQEYEKLLMEELGILPSDKMREILIKF